MNTTAHHVIFGTGAIGLATLDALRRRGESIRLVNRSGSAPVPNEVEVVGGDATDPQFTTAVTQGARVVYQTLNRPYSRWEEEFPALQAGVLSAAEANGARLVSMENVYMYGRPAGQPLTETRAYAAHTKKANCVPRWPGTCSPPTTPDASRRRLPASQPNPRPAAPGPPTSATPRRADQPHPPGALGDAVPVR